MIIILDSAIVDFASESSGTKASLYECLTLLGPVFRKRAAALACTVRILTTFNAFAKVYFSVRAALMLLISYQRWSLLVYLRCDPFIDWVLRSESSGLLFATLCLFALYLISLSILWFMVRRGDWFFFHN